MRGKGKSLLTLLALILGVNFPPSIKDRSCLLWQASFNIFCFFLLPFALVYDSHPTYLTRLKEKYFKSFIKLL